MSFVSYSAGEAIDFVMSEGRSDEFAHIVFPKSAITESIVYGIPCESLCGKVWISSRTADNLSVCVPCVEQFKLQTGSR
jgi:hypothetical protein